MRNRWRAFKFAAIGATLLLALSACSSDKASNPRDASDETVTGLDGSDRTFRVAPTGPNEFELRFVPPRIFRSADSPAERRERVRAMRLILQSKCPPGRTAQLIDPQDGTVARGQCT